MINCQTVMASRWQPAPEAGVSPSGHDRELSRSKASSALCRLLKRLSILLIAGLISVATFGPASAQARTADHPVHNQQRSPLEIAGLIHDLIADKLAANVDPQDLFQFSLGSADSVRAKVLLRLMGDGKLLARARRSVAALPELPPDIATMTVAQAEFLALPKARRTALLNAHRRRADRAMAAQALRAKKAATLEKLVFRAAGLQAFLEGKPADPATLSIDFLDPGEGAFSGRRIKALLTSGVVNDEKSKASEPTIDGRIASEAERIDSLWAQILALPPEKRAQLIAAQTAPPPEPTEIEKARKAADEAGRTAGSAVLAAQNARTEKDGLFESDRSKLLAVSQNQARYKAILAQKADYVRKVEELAPHWHQKVQDLRARSRLDPTRGSDADQLYFQLVEALRKIRHELEMALNSSSTGQNSTLAPPQLNEDVLRDRTMAAPLTGLQQKLADDAVELRVMGTATVWSERTALLNAMIDMNAIRLSLIDDLSSTTRSQVVGFGEPGVAQARREINQIILTFRFYSLFLPSHFDRLLHPVPSLTPQAMFSLIQLVVIIFVFRYWRKQGDELLAGAERSYRLRRPPTVSSAALAAGIGYFRQVRRPFDWFVFLFLVKWILPPDFRIPGADYIWLVILWLLAASFLVRLLDALAQGNRRNDPHALLRQRSLRLVANVVIVIGLILSITRQMVGAGAIYSWVLSACWLLVLPVTVLLTSWWREPITALASAGASARPILAWCVKNKDGLAGYFARTVAGIVLLLEGARGILIRRANDIALISELAGQRARSKAAARVAADEASGRFRPIAAPLAAALAPDHPPLSPDAASRSPGSRNLPKLTPGGLVAIIGERGLGKTTAMDGLTWGIPAADRISVKIHDHHYNSFLSTLGQALDVAGDESAILSALNRGPRNIVTVDDVQRLIVPAIGGLKSFDRLVSLARQSGNESSWVFAIGGPAWNYLSRARSDQAIFDQVVTLPRWEPSELRDLIERRTRQAGLDPVFDPSEQPGIISFDSDITPEERVKRAYFASLDDYCDGNPAVALEFWRRSLFEDTRSGRVMVLTFKTPVDRVLLAMQQSTIFVLRAILQMEVAVPDTIALSTDFSPPLVADAIRNLVQGGIIKPHELGYRVTLFWYREVIRMLERQNLLVRSEI